MLEGSDSGWVARGGDRRRPKLLYRSCNIAVVSLESSKRAHASIEAQQSRACLRVTNSNADINPSKVRISRRHSRSVILLSFKEAGEAPYSSSFSSIDP